MDNDDLDVKAASSDDDDDLPALEDHNNNEGGDNKGNDKEEEEFRKHNVSNKVPSPVHLPQIWLS